MNKTGLSLPAASDTAHNFTSFFNFMLIVSTILFVLTVAAGIYFVIKYRRRSDNDPTIQVHGNDWVEWGSMFIIAVISAIIFFWGYRDYKRNITPKADEYEISILGQQWNWLITYSNGRTLMNEMYLPEGRPVKLVMTSKDVLHSFFIPAFRVKMDTVPGMYTSLRFTPTKTGVFDIFCAEYCGTSHSGMIGKAQVLSKEDFAKWEQGLLTLPSLVGGGPAPTTGATAAAATETPVQRGERLFKSKTCNTCHSIDGTRLVGPTFKGVWGRTDELADGTSVVVDENYFRESMLEPMKKVVKGYPPAMPTFKGLLTEEEINDLIAYAKTLK